MPFIQKLSNDLVIYYPFFSYNGWIIYINLAKFFEHKALSWVDKIKFVSEILHLYTVDFRRKIKIWVKIRTCSYIISHNVLACSAK